jgi:NADH:ubiquinone oxidoreductase subunit 5 (subunit L)/multisubunit Na+/H+ antiporter MnhA subunit
MILSINDAPCWYLIVAVIVTVYQSYRGFMFQWIFAKERKSADSPDQQKQITWTRTQKIILLSIADMLFYLITTVLGFVSLFVSYHILTHLPSLSEVSPGLAALLIFLIVFGVLGVSAQLPYLIQQGKFPWKQ